MRGKEVVPMSGFTPETRVALVPEAESRVFRRLSDGLMFVLPLRQRAAVRVSPQAKRKLYAIVLRHPGGLVELVQAGLTDVMSAAYLESFNRHEAQTAGPKVRIQRCEMSWSVEVFPGRYVTCGPLSRDCGGAL